MLIALLIAFFALLSLYGLAKVYTILCEAIYRQLQSIVSNSRFWYVAIVVLVLWIKF